MRGKSQKEGLYDSLSERPNGRRRGGSGSLPGRERVPRPVGEKDVGEGDGVGETKAGVVEGMIHDVGVEARWMKTSG